MKTISTVLTLLILAFYVHAVPNQTQSSPSRGYLTTPTELASIKAKHAKGIEPYKSSVNALLNTAGSPSRWPYGTVFITDRDQLQNANDNIKFLIPLV